MLHVGCVSGGGEATALPVASHTHEIDFFNRILKNVSCTSTLPVFARDFHAGDKHAAMPKYSARVNVLITPRASILA